MNTDNFIIESSDIELAQSICKMIHDSSTRNRAVANAVAGSIASKFFDKESYDVDSESGLHNIGKVLENIDISDIYINGNYIDVRISFSEEELSVPEVHFKNNILPVAYMFIKINEDLSGATVLGFVTPENISRDNLINGNYHISENDLQSFYDIELLLVNKDDDIEVSDKEIFGFLDDSLSDVNAFYSNLIESKDARLRLAKAAKAKEIFQFVSVVNNSDELTIIPEANNEDSLLSESDISSFTNINPEDSLEELLNSDNSDDLVLEEFDSDVNMKNEIEELHFDETDDGLGLEEENELLNIENSDSGIDSEDETIELSFDETDDELDLEEENELRNIEGSGSGIDSEDETIELSFDETDEEFSSEEELNIEESNSDIDTKDETLELSFDEEIENQEAKNEDESLVGFTEIETFSELNNEQIIDIGAGLEEGKTATEEQKELVIEDETDVVELLQEKQEEEFDFSTVTTPNTESTEVLEELSRASDIASENNNASSTEANEQIEVLFNNENHLEDEKSEAIEDNQEELKADNEEDDDEIYQDIDLHKSEKRKNSIKPVGIISLLLIAGALGYFGYTKYFANSQNNNEFVSNDMPIDNVQTKEEAAKIEEAMPVETLDAKVNNNAQNEGVSETIPVIEENLDASILVSNLKVDWEVPAGYTSNASAKRYLIKLGKIIQLNLKTELLLLNKPPITNKISVEIKYNSGNRKFETVGIVVSSGEKSVDDLILHTVSKVLKMNLSVNTDSLSKLQGNPVLIIHL